MQCANIPQEMRDERRWVVWKFEERKGDKPTKVPYVATWIPENASSTNPDTWRSYPEAVAVYGKGGYYSGIGFVLGDGWCGVDFDHIIRDGQMLDWPEAFRAECHVSGSIPSPAEIINSLGTYWEISPSGTGVKLFGKGTVPPSGHKLEAGGVAIEIYGPGRYFAVTGNGPAVPVADITDPVARLHYAVFGPQKRAKSPSQGRNGQHLTISAQRATRSDKEIWFRAMHSKYADSLKPLMRGDGTGYESRSQADFRLAYILSAWSKDPEQIARMMQQTKLRRAKWIERPDYLLQTAERAIFQRLSA